MKKIELSCIMLIIMLLQSFSAMALSVSKTESAVVAKNFTIKFNGNTYTARDGNANIVFPIVVNGSTYLPLRAISKLAGMKVEWDGATTTINLTKEEGAQPDPSSVGTNNPPTIGDSVDAVVAVNFVIKFNGDRYIPRNGSGEEVYPLVIQGTTYLPVRAISVLAGFNVDWNGTTRTVSLTTKDHVEVDEKGNILERELNNDAQAAMAFPINKGIKGTIYGDIVTGKDRADYYKIDVPSEGVMTLTLNSTEECNPNLYLYDKGGNSTIESDIGDTKAIREIQIPLQKGVYCVVIKSTRPGEYVIKNEFKALEKQLEPNNELKEASAIVFGETVEGLIYGKNENNDRDSEDWYTFTLIEEKEVSATLKRDTVSSGTLTIYNEANSTQVSDISGVKVERTVKKVLKAGKYYIKVRASDDAGKYTITLN